MRDGDVIRIDCEAGLLEVDVDATEFASRTDGFTPDPNNHAGMGRELFGLMRRHAGSAEQGACALFTPDIAP